MHDKFKKRYQAPKASERVRRQIAVEAARRLYDAIGPEASDPLGRLRDASESDLYTAKRKAAAVLGHRVRPGDLPSDAEVREQVITLARSRPGALASDEPDPPEPEHEGPPVAMADHLDRFAIYRMRLLPLESVKQNPKYHPEGDALYHSLQVYEHARAARPYDEEFLLAALLHDVGKAIDPSDHVAAALDTLRGAVTPRTLWLIEHHMDLLGYREKGLSSRARKALEGSEYADDLKLLRDLDDAGRTRGAPVSTVDEALAFLKDLEDEAYLA
jgi:HD domain